MPSPLKLRWWYLNGLIGEAKSLRRVRVPGLAWESSFQRIQVVLAGGPAAHFLFRCDGLEFSSYDSCMTFDDILDEIDHIEGPLTEEAKAEIRNDLANQPPRRHYTFNPRKGHFEIARAVSIPGHGVQFKTVRLIFG
jgi:hypothetical protein